MDEDLRVNLVSIIRQVLLRLRPHLHEFSVPYLEWRRDGNGWRGEYRNRPDHTFLAHTESTFIGNLSSQFASAITANFPEYKGGLIKIGGGAGANFESNPGMIFNLVLSYVWSRLPDLVFDAAKVNEIVNELIAFLRSSKVSILFQADLLNFSMEADRLEIEPNLVIRRLSEAEVSEIHGGFERMRNSARGGGTIHEFVMEFRSDVPKERWAHEPIAVRSEVESAFDKVVRALVTFQSGAVGFEFVAVRYPTVALCAPHTTGHMSRSIPPGSYRVSAEDIPVFAAHLPKAFAITDSAILTATRRLVDAETRRRSEDKLFDAVVGMEALLLAALRPDERRGELKFRFSMNYAFLSSAPQERANAYKRAKALYDLRSTVAHGGTIGNVVKFAGNEIALHQAASLAADALRYLIQHFLSLGNDAPHKRPAFWEGLYFSSR